MERKRSTADPDTDADKFLLKGVADEWALMIADGVNARCTYEKMSVGVKELTDNQLPRARAATQSNAVLSPMSAATSTTSNDNRAMALGGKQSAWVCYAAMFLLSNFDYVATESCVRQQQSGGCQQLRPSEGVFAEQSGKPITYGSLQK